MKERQKKSSKSIKPRCKCSRKINSVLKCHVITEDDRTYIFKRFWSMTWQEKKVYIDGLVKLISTNRKRDRKDPEVSKRTSTFVYHLRKGEELIRVCKISFLNTVCIGMSSVWSWKTIKPVGFSQNTQINKEEVTMGKSKPFYKDNKELDNFIDAMPKMESHYCRQRTSGYIYNQKYDQKRNFITYMPNTAN